MVGGTARRRFTLAKYWIIGLHGKGFFLYWTGKSVPGSMDDAIRYDSVDAAKDALKNLVPDFPVPPAHRDHDEEEYDLQPVLLECQS